jgi:L-seryl-tRNA(Ser) seleniumtransferase
MEELLKKSGQIIADLLGAEAALVTSGCFAALVQGAAGIMTGKDPAKIAQLPDATGLKNEFLIQKPTRYHYDRCVSVPGGRLVEVGEAQGCTAEQLEDAIGPNTAGILYLAAAEGSAGTVSLAETAGVARRHGIALLVDAAAVIFPIERLKGLPKSGADLICFGAKYFGSTNSTGILCGRRDLVDAASLNGFVAYETEDNHAIGRGYKVDRQEVVATVVALQEWLAMDHTGRFRIQEQRIQTISDRLADLAHVAAECIWDNSPWMRLQVTFDEGAVGKTAAEVCQALGNGDPSIRMRPAGEGVLVVGVHTLNAGEEQVVARRLREELSA